MCEEYRWEMDEWIAKLSMKIAPDSDEDIVTKIYTMLLGGSLKGRSFLQQRAQHVFFIVRGSWPVYIYCSLLFPGHGTTSALYPSCMLYPMKCPRILDDWLIRIDKRLSSSRSIFGWSPAITGIPKCLRSCFWFSW